MARRDPTVGGALVEGIVVPPHPPFHSHALCIDHTSRTGQPAGYGGCLGGAVGKVQAGFRTGAPQLNLSQLDLG